MFEVYLHTAPNGKSYVGWTSLGLVEAWWLVIAGMCIALAFWMASL